jgi:transcriptional regulator with XRE-family HTH domain
MKDAGGRAPFEPRLVRLAIDQPERDALARAFAHNLRLIRIAAHLTQQGLASRCFLSHADISKFERAHTLPSFEILLLLRDAVGVSIDVLTDGVPAPTRAAGRAQLMELIARNPESQSRALATLSELPNEYVFQGIRYLESYGQIRNSGGSDGQPG